MNAIPLNEIPLGIKCVHYCIKWNFKKISNFKFPNFIDITFDDKDLPGFVTKKWIEVYDQSGRNCNDNKEIRINTSMLRSDLCDYSDGYIVVQGNITVTKEIFTADDIEATTIQQYSSYMQLLLILQMIMGLVKKSWFLKTMLDLSIAFYKLMV